MLKLNYIFLCFNYTYRGLKSNGKNKKKSQTIFFLIDFIYYHIVDLIIHFIQKIDFILSTNVRLC